MDKTEINNRFIQAINSLLQDKGLTKSSIASSLDIKPAKFSEILNNRMNAGTDTIAKLCALYSFNTSWLLLGEGPMLIPGVLKGRSKPAVAIPKLPDFPMTSEGVCEMFLSIMENKDYRYKEQAEEVGMLKGEINYLKRQISEAGELKEEIGRLKEQIRQLTIEKEKHVSDAPISSTANVGSEGSSYIYAVELLHGVSGDSKRTPFLP